MASEFIQIFHAEMAAVRAKVAAGLSRPQAEVAPKYFYDALGSRLFSAICELPEYYLTRTERGIFAAHGAAMDEAAGQGVTLIDLGAGDCAKAASLFHYLQPRQYVPVDISVDFLRDAVVQLCQRFPALRVTGLGLDFSAGIELPSAVSAEKRLFFYPGSSIGNFTPEQAMALLRAMRSACGNDGGLLIGVDLVKSRAQLEAAYDDALGVTAAFNLNLLSHVNRLLGSNFSLRDWRHRAFFNPGHSRVEMHLEARISLSVSWPGGERHFAAGERIHTENSYKYTQQDFLGLLERCGFTAAQVWTDPARQFMVCHAAAGA